MGPKFCFGAVHPLDDKRKGLVQSCVLMVWVKQVRKPGTLALYSTRKGVASLSWHSWVSNFCDVSRDTGLFELLLESGPLSNVLRNSSKSNVRWSGWNSNWWSQTTLLENRKDITHQEWEFPPETDFTGYHLSCQKGDRLESLTFRFPRWYILACQRLDTFLLWALQNDLKLSPSKSGFWRKN